VRRSRWPCSRYGWPSGPPRRRTYGYNRAEILAAAVNALSLWLIAAWIVWEAIHRFISPEIEGGTVLIVGGIGLLVNVVAAYMLHGASGHSLNVEGALQHVLADLMGSVAVIISAVIIILFGGTSSTPS